jgi:hypothetical protein
MWCFEPKTPISEEFQPGTGQCLAFVYDFCRAMKWHVATSKNSLFGRICALRYSLYPGTAPLLKHNVTPKNEFLEATTCHFLMLTA